MEQISFNLQLLNLMIGLFKDHPFYRPISSEIKSLGYYLSGIERTFHVGRRETTPEIMVSSAISGHTIMVESTFQNSLNNSKKNQIENYLRVSQTELSGSAGLPSTDCFVNTTWVIVRDSAIENYKVIDSWQKNNGFILSAFNPNASSGFLLKQAYGSFVDNNLDLLLKPQVNFPRIYQGYVTIPTDNLQIEYLVQPTMQLLVSFIVRNKYEFNIEDIAKGLIPIWNEFSSEKRKGVLTGLDRLFSTLKHKQYTENMLQRVPGIDKQWVILMENDKSSQYNQNRLFKIISRFQNEYIGGQLTLDMEIT